MGTLLVSDKDYPARKQFLVTCVVSVVIAWYVENQTVEKAFVKWPNDIYIKDKKISGLLIENQRVGDKLRFSLIGIGLNVNEAAFPDYLLHAISILQLTGEKRDIEQIAMQLGSEILQALALYSAVRLYRQHYVDRLYLLDTSALYRVNDKTARGTLQGIDEFGRFLLHFDGEDRVFGFKEVEFILS